ncbi:hypothetical protein [Nocardia sp. XZ_19_385]|uniref:hypothetical protein n=1 Tax=Nocardia sp. XZ_19_385 TaxID=2769488 RepID=UPI00188F5A0F|nr:hypothetical protein [Nocardia sp. XZ_19_385]
MKEVEDKVVNLESRLDFVIVLDTDTVTYFDEKFQKVDSDIAGVQACIGGDLHGTLEGRSVVTRLDSIAIDVQLMNQRLGSMDERFGSMDKRFESMDKRFESMDKRFESMDKRFESIDERFGSMDKRFESIDGRLSILTEDVGTLKTDVGSLASGMEEVLRILRERGEDK